MLDRNITYLHAYCCSLLDRSQVINDIKATPKVTDDICASFNIDTAAVFRTTTYRQK